MCMRKACGVLLIFLLLFSSLSYSQENINNSVRIRKQLSDVLSELAVQIEKFESFEKKLNQLVDLEKYSDQKNIIMSSIIATSAISSICEYELDIDTILIEMKNQNSQFYDEARIESIKISIQQIQSIQKLIQISNTLIVVDKAYNKLIVKQNKAIENVVSILSKSMSIRKKQ